MDMTQLHSGLTETLVFESNIVSDEEEIKIWDITLLDGLDELDND